MKVALAGRVKNLDLPKSKPLLPLLEAVSNSIDSIEDEKGLEGKILIRILREDTTIAEDKEGRAMAPIIGFDITDNGQGFTNQNFESFDTCDSILKQSKGAKGIGRLLWLKAFADIRVSSTYNEIDGKFYSRSFRFELPDGVVDATKPELATGPARTVISLRGFRAEYEKACPKRTATIVERLLAHLASSFLNPSLPAIELIDEAEPAVVNLNARFKEYFTEYGSTDSFTIKGHTFDIHHLRLVTPDPIPHTIQLTAAFREVRDVHLKNRAAGLASKLQDSDGNAFVYIGIVSGALLTEKVNPNRTDFDLPHDADLVDNDLPSTDQIITGATEQALKALAPFLEQVRKSTRQEIRRVIENEYPEYRSMMPEIEKHLDDFAPGCSHAEIARKINEIQFEAEQESRQDAAEILKKPQAEDSGEYHARYRAYLAKVTQEAQTRLAQYVVHRKSILDVLQERLKLKADEKYPLEEDIHELIFPMKTTSDDPGVWGHQNLWLIDERLAYHTWLASDVPLKSQEAVASDISDRPDLLIMNRPGAFTADDPESPPLQSVTIVELKRPGKTNFRADKKDPIEQVLGYIDEIRNGTVKPNGRALKVTPTTSFFAYVICDVDKGTHAETLAKNYLSHPTPDGMGWYGYRPMHNAYVEMISFDKLVRDARQRNLVFFKRLGIQAKLSDAEIAAMTPPAEDEKKSNEAPQSGDMENS